MGKYKMLKNFLLKEFEKKDWEVTRYTRPSTELADWADEIWKLRSKYSALELFLLIRSDYFGLSEFVIYQEWPEEAEEYWGPKKGLLNMDYDDRIMQDDVWKDRFEAFMRSVNILRDSLS